MDGRTERLTYMKRGDRQREGDRTDGQTNKEKDDERRRQRGRQSRRQLEGWRGEKRTNEELVS